MIKICKKCLMPNTRPRVTFNIDQVCNGCVNAASKPEIDWDNRKTEFEKILNENKSINKNTFYDCIVPWSGGKDSSVIAYKLKYEYNLNPLLVTFSPMMPTEVGEHNREEMLKAGFDHIFVRPNQRVSRHLARRFFIERGNPKVCWDAGINSIPVQTAVNLNIPLIFYAEHGESEYGGKLLSENHAKIRDITEVLEHQIGDDPMNWMDQSVNENELAPYIYPNLKIIQKKKIKAIYFGYFFPWDIYENYKYISNKINFKTAPNNRTSGTFTNYDSLDDKIDNLYYYMQYIKFGFGRSVRDASRLIMLGHQSRKDGLELAKKYDSEFPEIYLEEVLEYLSLSREQFLAIIDKHRNPEIWKQEKDKWETTFEIS